MRILVWWCCGGDIAFPSTQLLPSLDPIPFLTYAPLSIRGKAQEQKVLSLVEKGAVKLAPLPSPGFYSHVFVVMKASGSWRPELSRPPVSVQDGHPSVSSPLSEAW